MALSDLVQWVLYIGCLSQDLLQFFGDRWPWDSVRMSSLVSLFFLSGGSSLGLSLLTLTLLQHFLPVFGAF